jgi:hypothetical protein
MTGKKISADDFLTVLRDDRVRKELYEIYEPMIKLTVTEIFKNFQKEMCDKVDSLNTTVQVIRTEIASRNDAVAKLTAQNASLVVEVDKLKMSVDELEQYSRRDNLIITGIPSSFAEAASTAPQATGSYHESSASCIDKVVSFFQNKLNIDVQSADISTAHRLPAGTNGQLPLVVKFVRRIKRDTVYQARTKLKDHNKNCARDSRIFINEDLSPINRNIFSAAWRKQGSHGIESVWSSNCRVMARHNGRARRISSLAELNSLSA